MRELNFSTTISTWIANLIEIYFKFVLKKVHQHFNEEIDSKKM